MSEKGFYLLINARKTEIVTLSDNYDLLIEFMVNHVYICKQCVVRQVKKKEFEEALLRYDEYYLCDVDGIPIRQKDVSTFLRLKDEESANLINTIIGLNRMMQWGGLKKKDKDALGAALKTIYKYMDDDEKMLKKSGIKNMCSDINYLESIQELDYKR